MKTNTFKRVFIKGFKKLLRLGAIMAVVTFLLKMFQFGTTGMSDFLNRLMLYMGFLLPFILGFAILGGLAFAGYAVWKEKKQT